MSYAAEPLSTEIGAGLGVLTLTPTTVDLFRYSAATRNTHRIHYDPAYAEREGYPDVLLQGHLRGAYASLLCTHWLDDRGDLLTVDFSPRRYVVQGLTVSYSGHITDAARQGDGVVHVDVAIQERAGEGDEPSGTGRATLAVRQ